MVVRAGFILLLAMVLGSGMLTLAGVLRHDVSQLVAGLAGLTAAVAGIYRLRHTGRLGELVDSMDFTPSAEHTGNVELAGLRERLACLESKRGTSEFKPWRLLALRREIERRERRLDRKRTSGSRSRHR
jgi:hypothetical protein